MRGKAKYSFGAILIVAVISFFGCSKEEQATVPKAPEGFETRTGAGVSFQWQVQDEHIEIILSAETEGWIAVGFNPETMMQGANLIIGYVSEGEVNLRDDYGSWLTSHVSDTSNNGSSDLTIIDGEENEGKTRLRFRIPLKTEEDFEGDILLGQKNKVLLAYGAKDDFDSMHRNKTSIEVEF